MDSLVLRLWRVMGTRRWWRGDGALRFVARCVRQPWALRVWLDSVETHERIVAGGPQMLRLPPHGRRTLWHTAHGPHRLQIVLYRRASLDGDGEMEFALFDGGTCVASIAFTLGLSGADKVAHAQPVRTTPSAFGLAASLQGMPADEFLRAAFRALCSFLGVTHILGTADFDPPMFEIDIPLDAKAQARQELLARVRNDIGVACGQAYAPTAPLVHLHAA